MESVASEVPQFTFSACTTLKRRKKAEKMRLEKARYQLQKSVLYYVSSSPKGEIFGYKSGSAVTTYEHQVETRLPVSSASNNIMYFIRIYKDYSSIFLTFYFSDLWQAKSEKKRTSKL